MNKADLQFMTKFRAIATDFIGFLAAATEINNDEAQRIQISEGKVRELVEEFGQKRRAYNETFSQAVRLAEKYEVVQGYKDLLRAESGNRRTARGSFYFTDELATEVIESIDQTIAAIERSPGFFKRSSRAPVIVWRWLETQGLAK